VVPRPRPVVDGPRRALLGLMPVRDADLVHGLDVDLPLRPSGPTVSTVHDTAVFDTPWAFGGVRARGERVLLRQALHRADAVIAVSAFTAQRVEELFGRCATVVPLAPAPRFRPPADEDRARVRARHGLPDRFVLHVGTIEPRKDVPMLAAAARVSGVPLVLAGALARGQAVPPGALHLGYVDAQDLPALYASATAVAYPSRYEGFGLPPLEALACGAAVVASRVGALPETLGEAAVLVEPRDEAALTAALRDVLADEDRRRAMREEGLRRARALTWQDTARATLEVYRRLGVCC
jgi:glycosyltransferase involved in cell wall biosynthesis